MVENLEVKTEPMFLSAPTTEDLKPTPTEKALMLNLIYWLDNSAKSYRCIGMPYC
jgi:hypothetical protein